MASSRLPACIRNTNLPVAQPTISPISPTARPTRPYICCAKAASTAPWRPSRMRRTSSSAISKRWNVSATPAGKSSGSFKRLVLRMGNDRHDIRSVLLDLLGVLLFLGGKKCMFLDFLVALGRLAHDAAPDKHRQTPV